MATSYPQLFSSNTCLPEPMWPTAPGAPGAQGVGPGGAQGLGGPREAPVPWGGYVRLEQASHRSMFLDKTPHKLSSLSLKPQYLGLGRGPGDHHSHPSFPVGTGGDGRPWGLGLAESSQSLLSQNPQGHTAQGTRASPKARRPRRSGRLHLTAVSPGRLCRLQLHVPGSSPGAPQPGVPPLRPFAPGVPPHTGLTLHLV